MKLNNKGLSLVELIVYMVVSVFVLGYAMDALTTLSKNFFHERKKGALQLNGQDAISMVAREVASTGFKHYLKKDTDASGDSIFTTEEIPATWTGSSVWKAAWGARPADTSASFFINKGDVADTLEIFRATLSDPYTLDEIQRITFGLDTLFDTLNSADPWKIDTISFLYHIKCAIADSNSNGEYEESEWNWDDADTTQLMTHVHALKFQFSEDYTSWEDDPESLEIRDNIRYVRIILLVRSTMEGDVRNAPSFDLGDTILTPDSTNKFLYRRYERVVEIPSNGVFL